MFAMANFEESVNMLIVLGECEKNYRKAAQVFAERYHVRKSHMAFSRLEQRLRNTGSLLKNKKEKLTDNEKNSHAKSSMKNGNSTDVSGAGIPGTSKHGKRRERVKAAPSTPSPTPKRTKINKSLRETPTRSSGRLRK